MSNQDLVKVETAIAGMDKVRAGLANLKQLYGGVAYHPETPEGMKYAVAARRACAEPRIEVERIRKEAKAPILALGRELDRAAQQITAEIEAIEGPIDRAIKAEVARVEAEKQRLVDAEVDRVKRIRERIEWLRAVPMRAAARPLVQMEAVMRDLTNAWAPGTYAEFENEAISVYAATSERMKEMLTERTQFEEAQADIERKRVAQAEADRIAQVERDRIAAEDRQRQEREDAERRAAQKAEQDRLDAQRAELDRRQREADERDRLAREEAQAKQRAEEQAARDAEAAEQQRRATQIAESHRQARERVIRCVAADYVISEAAAEQLLMELFGGD